MRHFLLTLACACLALSCVSPTATEFEQAGAPCLARPAEVSGQTVTWHQGSPGDAFQLDRWCRAVGPPILVAQPVLPLAGPPPALEDLVVVSWNAHMAEGRLAELVNRLRAGALTEGKPVGHFVLLIQEAYRRGSGVPPFPDDGRTAFGIVPRDPTQPDAVAEAVGMGLSAWYVPSMRNGREMREDRGNAIVSTEPLGEPRALELPLARQRRVVAGATIVVRTKTGPGQLQVWSAHLEPVSSPETLWLFHNPRQGQVRAILSVLEMPAVAGSARPAGIVLGGDFNTIKNGDDESAYTLARHWSTSLAAEDRRRTHMMGRLDYLFFRLAEGWQARVHRADERFGSDHYPVAGQFLPSR
jgi:endonuclease/exonuclease/phosphatase family metal-dependent hydrolase